MSVKDFLISCIFPKRCAICDEVVDYNAEMCGACMNDFVQDSTVRCIQSRNVYNCFSPFCYVGKVRDIILKFKFHNNIRCVDFFSKEMAKMICTFCDIKDIDFICFVPMTKRSVLVRGYNQSEVLARSLGKVIRMPVNDILIKVRETQPQHSLSAKEREHNLSMAFSLRDDVDIKGKNFILCDDIITTGSTLKECIKVLESGGANKIICCTIAKTT